MQNWIYIILYVIFAVTGSTLLKYGGLSKIAKSFIIPLININVSFITVIGFICYGISFILYTILLNKFDLSFISPLTVALVYILLMITSFLVFKEPFNTYKVMGCILILVGIIIMIKGNSI